MADRIVDARGSHCPGPTMDLIRAVKAAQIGETIALLSSDPGSRKDIPLWVQKAGHELVATRNHEGYDELIVKKLR